MKKEIITYLDKIPNRIKYYLLDWKDDYLGEYYNRYGELALSELNKSQLYDLFDYATKKECANFLNEQK
jgi:hypothetical protein